MQPFFVRVPPDVISLLLFTPKVVGVKFMLCTVHNLKVMLFLQEAVKAYRDVRC
jgi:hypothetical protein